MPSPGLCRIVALTLALGLFLSCGRATGVPSDDSAVPTGSQPPPFGQQRAPDGSRSPGLPSTISKLPVGTPLTIRMLAPVSSASSRTGDTFEGRLDDPIVIEGQETVPRGAAISGRILAAKAAGGPRDPGYLRIALVALSVDGKRDSIETSSLFAKGGAHGRRESGPTTAFVTSQNDVSFSPERRLTFRIARAVELP